VYYCTAVVRDWELAPGEMVEASVSVKAAIGEEPVAPGTYHLAADFHGVRTLAVALTVTGS
jgi:hypothetical protein